MTSKRIDRTLAVLLIAAFACNVGAQGLQPIDDRGSQAAPGASAVVLEAIDIRSSGARTLVELLAGRVAGLSVTFQSGISGTAARVQARGAPGFYGAMEPLLYVDGFLVREERHDAQFPFGEFAVPFAWDLPADEIERVEVILGPAGGALLEFGAARGAVLVTTKRPRGPRRVETFAEYVTTSHVTHYPDHFGTLSAEFPSDAMECTRSRQALGQCTALSSVRWNPLAESSPFATGIGARASVRALGEIGTGGYRLEGGAQRAGDGFGGAGLGRIGFAGAFTQKLRDVFTVGAEFRYAQIAGDYPAWSEYIRSSFYDEQASAAPQPGYVIPVASLEAITRTHSADRLSMQSSGELKLGESVTATIRLGADFGKRRAEGTAVNPMTLTGTRVTSGNDENTVSAVLGLSHRHPTASIGAACSATSPASPPAPSRPRFAR